MPSTELTSPAKLMKLYLQGSTQGDLFACFTQLFNSLLRKLEIDYVFEHWQLCFKHLDKILSYVIQNLETSALLLQNTMFSKPAFSIIKCTE